MKKSFIETLSPLKWEKVDGGEYCSDSILGRFWIVPAGKSFKATFTFLRYETATTEDIGEATSLAAAKAACWDRYCGDLAKAFVTSAKDEVEEVKGDPDAIVAWLAVWPNGARELSTRNKFWKLDGDEPVTHPLSMRENGTPVAWAWTDGGGYNADYRLSFVDPREDEEELYMQNATCVGSCAELYHIKT